jgi:hypothetical protein
MAAAAASDAADRPTGYLRTDDDDHQPLRGNNGAAPHQSVGVGEAGLVGGLIERKETRAPEACTSVQVVAIELLGEGGGRSGG